MVPRLGQFRKIGVILTLNQVSFVPHVLKMGFEVFPVLGHAIWWYVDMAWSSFTSSFDSQKVLVSAISCKVSLRFRDDFFWYCVFVILLNEVDDVVIFLGTKYKQC